MKLRFALVTPSAMMRRSASNHELAITVNLSWNFLQNSETSEIMSPALQLDLCALVLILAAIQSVFGVGLLVFGTPILLLIGFPFPVVLAYLLPCSLVISTLQIAQGGLTFEPIRRKLLAF